MLTKQYRTRVKAHKDADGTPTGEVTAIVSAFGNVDLVGDRVVKGAFAKTLQDFKDSGSPIPMIWSHDWSNPMSHIGSWDASKAVETDEGLELTGQVFINDGNPIADQAYKLMEKQLVREFSFAYDVIQEQSAKDGANELLELALIEAGPTLKGANNETRLVAAKALAKAGRTISAKNESALREALDAMATASGSIKSVLSALDAPEEKNMTIADELKADDEPTADAPEPHALQPVMDGLKAAVDGIAAYIGAEVKDEAADDEKDADEQSDDTAADDAAPKSFDHDDVLRRLFVAEHG